MLEVVDEHYQSVKHGERGRVLVTNLVQKTLPLIRFDLYDFATLGRSSFGAETLISLDGKSFDSLPVRLKSGSTERIPAYELTEIQVPGLQRIQFLSHSPDHFEVWYMAEGELDREIESAVRSVLETRAAAVNQVDVKRVDYLPSGKGTKFFHVMNPDKRFVELHSVSNDPIPNQQLLKKKTRKPLIPQEEYEQGTIPVVFHRIANLIGDKIAVEDQVNLLTYNQLEVLANNVAYRLLDFPLDPSRPVAIFCPHQPIVTALILGVLKAGGFYLPLDIHLPTSRLIQILAETHPQIMLTAIDGIDTKRFPPGLDLHIIAVDQSPQKKVQAYALPDIPAESPACLIYTSGSTGTPQGFVLSHRTVHRRASRYIEDYRIAPEDKLTLLQSFTVSAGVREIFGALLSGATLSMFDLQERGIQPLPAWIQDRGITHLYMVPSIWRVFLEAMSEEVFESLRMIRLGGEPMGVEDWDGFKARMSPGCILANGYAATETGTICQYFLHQDTEISSGRIPVGFPVNGIEVKLLPENQPSGSVTLGEIAVDSETLAMGSWDPMKKVVLPFQDGNYPTGDLGYQVQDGRIFLLDRKDRLVKVHGNRVNLNEVETAAIAIEGVVSAAAVLMKEGDELASIVLFYVLDPDCDKSQNDIRNELRSKLPGPAVPKLIQQLQDLPRLPGGKVNPYNLTIGSIDSPDLEIAEVLYRNDTEEELAEIWKDILQVERVEREDDFINLGGDSIMVFRVQNRIREHFGVQISVREFFEATQLNTMAAWIMAQTIVGMESPSGISALVTLRSTGSKPPLFFVPPAASTAVQFKRLAQYLGEDQPVYAFEYPGMDGKIEPLTSIPDMAKIFIKEILKIQPLGPYYVAGMCYGGIVAFEVAQQLLGSGLSVAFLGILDSNTAPRKNKPLAYYGYVLRQFIHKNILGREGMVGKLFPRKRRGELDLEDPFVQRIYQVFKANHYAGLQYTSPPYPGLITKFSTDWPIAKQATRFWRNATTVGLEDHVVPGSHIRRSPDDTHMLDEPNIQVVAQKLRECLQRAAT